MNRKFNLIIVVLMVLISISCSLITNKHQEIESKLPTNDNSANENTIIPNYQNNQKNFEIKWSSEYESYALYDDKIFLSFEGKIQAKNISTGSTTWESDIKGPIMGVDEKFVYINTSPLRIDAIRQSTGELAWKTMIDLPGNYKICHNKLSKCLFIIHDNIVVLFGDNFGLPYGPFVVLDRNSGEIKYYTSDFIYANQDILIIGEKINTFGYKKVVLNQNGDVIWESEDYDPIYDCENVLVMVSETPLSEGNYRGIYDYIAINASNGNKLWNLNSNLGLFCRDIRYSSSFTNLGGIYKEPGSKNIFGLLFSYDSDDVILILLNKEKGSIELKGNKIDHRGYGGNKFLGGTSDKLFYSNDKFGITQAYDTINHSLIWENSKISLDSIHGILENVLIARANDELIAIDINTGTILWQKEYDVGNNDVFIKNNTLIFFAPFYVSIMDPRTGEIQSSFEISSRYLGEVIPYENGFLLIQGAPRIISFISP